MAYKLTLFSMVLGTPICRGDY